LNADDGFRVVPKIIREPYILDANASVVSN
jgi:hypothetical protein